MKTQAIIFDKLKYNKLQVERWLKKYGYVAPWDLHITKNFIRARLIDPAKFKQFITMPIETGIKFIMGSNAKGKSKSKK